MNHDEQKELARKLFPFIDIDAEEDCFEQIIQKLKPHRERVLEIIEGIEIPSEWSYMWARNIGDKELMRDRITESEWAYYWAKYLGDRELMRDRITESEWAYYWARFIGDRELMRERITESEFAYRWATNIGDQEIMDKVIAKEALQELADEAQELDMGY